VSGYARCRGMFARGAAGRVAMKIALPPATEGCMLQRRAHAQGGVGGQL